MCYVKFMSIPSYTYLKLKIPGPIRDITVEAKVQQALDCEKDNIELATATIVTSKLRELSLPVPLALLGSAMPATSSAFKMAKDAKAVQIDTEDPAKTVRIEASLDPKYESELINFLRRNKDIFAWSPTKMLGVFCEVAKHTLNIKIGSRPVKQGLQCINQEKRRAMEEEISRCNTHFLHHKIFANLGVH
jgi:hypothetical protein